MQFRPVPCRARSCAPSFPIPSRTSPTITRRGPRRGAAMRAKFPDPQPATPAYHAQGPEKGQELPPILSGNQLTGQFFREKWQGEVYKEAAQIPTVLYQLPCYCRCDRALGHTSLHSCFEGTHGAICATCAAEGAYAWRMTKQGRTPEQIRAGIERKEYESIDLDALGRS